MTAGIANDVPARRTRPVIIGLTTYTTQAAWGVWKASATLLPQPYLDAVSRAGGVPVLLPSHEAIDAALPLLDGLILSGGPDVDPARYGQRPGPDTQPPHRERDAAETALVEAATRAGMPVLGICRGLQLLNVSRGGTLVQHLPPTIGTDVHSPAPGKYGSHPVRVAPGSLLARALAGPDGPKEHPLVPSYHHQGVERLGTGLVPTAWSEDGVIEAAEDPSLPFCLAVQWHPEAGTDLSLFEALIAAAGVYSRARDLTVVNP